MNRKQVLAVLLMALSLLWAWLAWGSLQRGKTLIAVLQGLAGVATLARGWWDFRKARDEG